MAAVDLIGFSQLYNQGRPPYNWYYSQPQKFEANFCYRAFLQGQRKENLR